MSATLKQAQRYAALKKTKVFETEGGYKLQEDGSITFVLMSGPKLNMTEKELNDEIKAMEKARAIENQILEIKGEEPEPEVESINFKDGISEKEASTAGKALRASKSKKGDE